jgi:hypothetical protein
MGINIGNGKLARPSVRAYMENRGESGISNVSSRTPRTPEANNAAILSSHPVSPH